jgi:SNF2 family DNA or RNA helicase
LGVQLLLMEVTSPRHIVPGALTYYKYHGHARKIDYPRLLEHDIVFTTYGTIAAEFWRNRSLLHAIHWYRIVLDEGAFAFLRSGVHCND